MDTSYTVTSGSTSGNSYKFKVRAKNVYGFGSYSPIATIKSSEEPGQPDPVTIIDDDTNVKITWTIPSSNNESISNY